MGESGSRLAALRERDETCALGSSSLSTCPPGRARQIQAPTSVTEGCVTRRAQWPWSNPSQLHHQVTGCDTVFRDRDGHVAVRLAASALQLTLNDRVDLYLGLVDELRLTTGVSPSHRHSDFSELRAAVCAWTSRDRR
jgi:hypothetical protein